MSAAGADAGVVAPDRDRAVPGWLARAVVLGRPAGLYVASRPLVLGAVALTGRLGPPVSLSQGLLGWDGAWNLAVARSGYPSSVPMAHGHVLSNPTPFFPLFPGLVRALAFVPGVSLPVAGLLAAALLGLAATVTVWALCAHLWGHPAADRAAALFCFFPGALVLSMVYYEGLLVTLAAGCLLALRTRRWLAAGVLAGLATATSPLGVAVVAACAWEALVAIRRRGEWWSLAAPALAPTGILAYLAFLWVRTGDPTILFATERQGWHQHYLLSAPWKEAVAFVQHPFVGLNAGVMTLGAVFVIVTGALLVRARAPGALVVYTAVVVALAAFSTVVGLRPRMVLVAFPLFAVLGYRVRGATFGALMGVWGAGTVLFGTVVVAGLIGP
ncbi:MAG TPA: hypothetical protein VE152_00470 [Acidimicrobiales bacterium]|nr:hypothetical protein [Acidimicrobiales bacterium]